MGRLTFGSITGAGRAPRVQAAAPNNAHALDTLKKLTELQKAHSGQPQKAETPANTTALPAASLHRVLKPGYVNGGTVKTDTSAELMRLTALVDSLNSKVLSQAERLQKTESSLLKANNAITTERASHNARVVRMQAELKTCKDLEGKLRSYVSELEAASADRSDKRSFEEAVKEAEDFDRKISGLEMQIASLSEEKMRIAVKLDGYSNERCELMAQLKVEKDAASSTAAGAEARIMDAQRRLEAVEHERDTLAKDIESQRDQTDARIEEIASKHRDALERIALADAAVNSLTKQLESEKQDTGARMEELESKHKEALEQAASASANVDAIVEARNRFQSELEISTHELAEARAALKAFKKASDEAEKADTADTAGGAVEVPVDLMRFDASAEGEMCGEVPLVAEAANVASRVVPATSASLTRRPNKLDAKIAAVAANYVELGISPFVARAGPAGGPNAHFDMDTGATSAAATGSGAPQDQNVVELIKSISLDITDACAAHRRQYLEAMDLPESEIVEQMEELMNAPVE